MKKSKKKNLVNERNESVVDVLLCNAKEAQLRNVLAMASRSIPDAEFVAMFRKEVAMSAVEAFDESIR